ncbi:hypothetical protein CNYM01_14280 [Colletotrichum nymphaeae SA-01]|uniref:Uncharacterized protein n=1 Tax=Colletotrichum nymphaeae SA-01 TaxID=1460502 RepID=A0A135UGH8_9PEZI|nr:hypothetical protein CNYM01_14280 [Colletotrichum nymphaeae SA-01]
MASTSSSQEQNHTPDTRNVPQQITSAAPSSPHSVRDTSICRGQRQARALPPSISGSPHPP